MNSEQIGRIVWIIIVAYVVIVCVARKFGNDDINSALCKSEFNFKGYVYAFPDSEKTKNYRLVADMYKSEGYYYVDRIHFKNGGYIDFDDCEEGNKNGEAFYCTPVDDERDWSFRFYGEMAK